MSKTQNRSWRSFGLGSICGASVVVIVCRIDVPWYVMATMLFAVVVLGIVSVVDK